KKHLEDKGRENGGHMYCEVLKSTRKFSHGKSDRASLVARRERLVKGADKPFPDCVIPEGLRLKFTAILTSSGHTRSKGDRCIAYA
ncbi:hypothetical protein AVEN_210417-1, partial [Araneus ventricosus]